MFKPGKFVFLDKKEKTFAKSFDVKVSLNVPNLFSCLEKFSKRSGLFLWQRLESFQKTSDKLNRAYACYSLLQRACKSSRSTEMFRCFRTASILRTATKKTPSLSFEGSKNLNAHFFKPAHIFFFLLFSVFVYILYIAAIARGCKECSFYYIFCILLRLLEQCML
jgi:uncharacterized protein YecE (DUF72 family)